MFEMRQRTKQEKEKTATEFDSRKYKHNVVVYLVHIK